MIDGLYCSDRNISKRCEKAVVPIPKPKPKFWEKRPVSLTDYFPKVAEGIWLSVYCSMRVTPIPLNQYEKRKDVSITHYLVRLLDTWLKNLANLVILAMLLALLLTRISAKPLI